MNYTMMCDAYELTMANSYYNSGKSNETAVFDVFFRKVPNDGGYAIMAGLDKVIDYISNLKFTSEDIEYFKNSGYGFSDEFLEYLSNFRFTGNIFAVRDGCAVFPNEPLVTVVAPLIEAQIVETAILSMINGAMEHATGARRIIEATPKNVPVMEFGARRADGCSAAIDSSIYGIMAGCVGTSNVIAAKKLGMKALGTMAHSYIESYDNELDAFKDFAVMYPNNALLLVDTYDTLRSGVPNAIKTFDYLKSIGVHSDNIGIRIDSGDLSYLSKKARGMLDSSGYCNAKICLSNGLNASTIESLVKQGAKFDSLGVGDNISKPSGRMGCVYKEVSISKNGVLVPTIKLSNDTIKIVNPGFKRVFRAYNKSNDMAICDIVCMHNEDINRETLEVVSLNDPLKGLTISNFYLEELQKPIFIDGNLVYDEPSMKEKREYCSSEMDRIYEEVKRNDKPQKYYVDGTKSYSDFKNDMILNLRNKVRRL